MIYITLVLALWLLFMGLCIETPNIKSKVLLELPCFVFSFIVGLWFCKQVGII